MSDSNSFGKMLLFVGILMLLVSAIMPGANGAWTALQGTLSVGPGLPAFDNPFALQTKTFTLYVAGNGLIEPPVSEVLPPSASPLNGCTNTVTPETGTWYRCLQTDDGNSTFISINSAGGNSCHGVPWCAPGYVTTVNMTDVPSNINRNYHLAFAGSAHMTTRVDFSCQREGLAEGGRVQFGFYRAGANISSDPPLPGGEFMATGDNCPYGGTGFFGVDSNFQHKNATDYSIVGPFDVSGDTVANWTGGVQMVITLASSPATVDISYVSVTILYLEDPTAGVSCGGDFLCQIGLVLSAIFQLGLFLVNGVVFVVTFIVEIVVFLFNIITGLFFGFLLVLVWLLTGTGAPPIVQAIIDVPIIAILGVMFFNVVKIIRGTGTVS